MAYLDDHPPVRSQFRDPRREPVSGVIVVHTAENVMDQVGPDTGAEGVANFIRVRDTPGSYHELVDSDSTIGLVRWTCEAFHDGTGSNPHSFGLSFACRAADWPAMTADKRDRFILRGAQRAAAFANWLENSRGIVIPAARITRDESENRVPGFISHAQRDPQRRTDPGQSFPWSQFLDAYADLMNGAPAPQPPPGEDGTVFFYERTFGTATRVVHVAGGRQVVVTGQTYETRCRNHPDFLGAADKEMSSRYDLAYGKPVT
jgi:hypothetical protein